MRQRLLPGASSEVYAVAGCHEMFEDIFPGHEKAEYIPSGSGAVCRLEHPFLHEVSLILFDIEHHEARPERCGGCSFYPPHFPFVNDVDGVSPNVSVCQSHGDAQSLGVIAWQVVAASSAHWDLALRADSVAVVHPPS